MKAERHGGHCDREGTQDWGAAKLRPEGADARAPAGQPLLRVLRLTLADEAIERLHLFRLMSLYGHPSVSQILDRLLYYCIQYS
jgi:hypothetical protein